MRDRFAHVVLLQGLFAAERAGADACEMAGIIAGVEGPFEGFVLGFDCGCTFFVSGIMTGLGSQDI